MSEHSTASANVSTKIPDSLDDAITDAENELLVLRKQQRRFQQAIRIFKANKRDGVPWPREPKEGSCAGS